ncbi:hypothetical protein [Cryobacterium sp. SO1]|uniref:hypothetical protein n=1 Tax=Cryobacterium sp. SO1 TaxID=1897061 RepID=UPI0010239FAB|nr:hypothetical protein [Cryobacterium sp. SO1]RZI36338.1 hypothetical protein BJQ95_01256 [Cryobacterium sp. SO1]
MSITPGFTAVEIRRFVHEYDGLAYGHKSPWLAERKLSRHRLARWRDAVYEGDLERGLIPREGSYMTIPPGKRSALEKARAAEQARHEAEVAELTARVRELEGSNYALGKAIGLLHSLNEAEPADTPTTTDPSNS